MKPQRKIFVFYLLFCQFWNLPVFGQTVRPTPRQTDELEIAAFVIPGAETITALTSAKTPLPQSVPTPAPVQNSTTQVVQSIPLPTPTATPSAENDFVVEFGDLPESLLASDQEEEEFSLDIDGQNFLPGSRLFAQLVAEREAEEEEKKKKSNLPENNREALLTENTENTENRNNNPQNNPVLVKKTTIIRTTTTFGGNGNLPVNTSGVAGLTSLPRLDAAVMATDDARRLVRLAAQGDGVPLPLEWAQYMVEAGRLFSIDPVLILEVCRQESRFRNNAYSPAGAGGLMQFIPATAARFGIDRSDPRQAIFGGAKYLRLLLNMFRGEIRSALAGYNAGEGAVIAYATGRTLYPKNGKVINRNGIRTPFGIPPYAETQNYVAVIYTKYLSSLRRLQNM